MPMGKNQTCKNGEKPVLMQWDIGESFRVIKDDVNENIEWMLLSCEQSNFFLSNGSSVRHIPYEGHVQRLYRWSISGSRWTFWQHLIQNFLLQNRCRLPEKCLWWHRTSAAQAPSNCSNREVSGLRTLRYLFCYRNRKVGTVGNFKNKKKDQRPDVERETNSAEQIYSHVYRIYYYLLEMIVSCIDAIKRSRKSHSYPCDETGPLRQLDDL
jgi:hypothetical protein